MAKKNDSQGKLKTSSIENKDNPNTSIRVDVKVGILHTVAKAIYATPVGKIREAVANAMDNDATWVVITADRTTSTLCIYDNGCGITSKRFKEIFESIGYPLLGEGPESKLSYFGLGLMSIFQLGDRINLFTRPRGKKEMLVLEIDAKEVFNQDNKEKSISKLSDFVTLQSTNEQSRKALSAPALNDFLEKELGVTPQNFTEIVIEEVRSEDLETICHPNFADELRKVLPLRIESDEPFLKRFTGSNSKEIKALLENKDFCPTIDVYFGVRGEISAEEPEPGEEEIVELPQEEIRQLWKYFPRFRTDLTFPDSNTWVYFKDTNEFAYYIVYTVAQDLHRHPEDPRENGFWVRNQNFLVKSTDFLERPGRGGWIINQPLRNWIFGEIFHKDMNRFLTVSRTEYLFEEKDFIDFRDKVFEIVRPLNKLLRKIWNEKSKIIECVIEPFSSISETGGTIEKTEQRLRQLAPPDIDEKDFREKMYKNFEEQRKKEIESEEARIDIILSQTEDPILLSKDENVIVQITPTLTDTIQDHQVSWDAEKEQIILSVSPSLFQPKHVLFLQETFEVVFVAMKEDDPGVSINVEDKKIYVNPFNKELSQYSISILDVLIALEVAHAMSQTMDELKENFLHLIGARPTGVYRYIAPLGDDLRRTQAFSRSAD